MTNADISKGAAFRALHERDGAFVIPNPWDIGTAPDPRRCPRPIA